MRRAPGHDGKLSEAIASGHYQMVLLGVPVGEGPDLGSPRSDSFDRNAAHQNVVDLPASDLELLLALLLDRNDDVGPCAVDDPLVQTTARRSSSPKSRCDTTNLSKSQKSAALEAEVFRRAALALYARASDHRRRLGDGDRLTDRAPRRRPDRVAGKFSCHGCNAAGSVILNGGPRPPREQRSGWKGSGLRSGASLKFHY